MKTTGQKLQDIIKKGGFEAKVAASILASDTFKCSYKQWEVIQCSHDDLDFSELNIINIDALKTDCSFNKMQEASRNAQIRSAF